MEPLPNNDLPRKRRRRSARDDGLTRHAVHQVLSGYIGGLRGQIPCMCGARVAVSSALVTEFLKMISPYNSEGPVSAEARWLVGWRSETCRGLRLLSGRSVFEIDHLVYVPTGEGGLEVVNFGWQTALDHWGVRECGNSFLGMFSRGGPRDRRRCER